MVEAAALEESRRPRVLGRRTRPEDAHLALDLLVGDAGVVGRAASRKHAELGEDLLRRVEGEVPAVAEPFGQRAHDAPVLPGLTGRRDRLTDADHPALGAGHGALVFLVQRA